MSASETFSAWVAQAQVAEDRLTARQRGLLESAFQFRQEQGTDYYSRRLLSHFLLHCQSGLKVAQIARLVGLSRPTASRQQGMSSKEAVQQAQHRSDGRPYGKLLPHYAGPIAEFLFCNSDASRADVLDFIDRTFAVRVSRIALYHFLKKFGLDENSRQVAATPAAPATPAVAEPSNATIAATPADPALAVPPLALPASVPVVGPGQPVPTPAPPFSLFAASMPALFC
jgi:transposase